MTAALACCEEQKPGETCLVDNGVVQCSIVIPAANDVQLWFPSGASYSYAAKFLQTCFEEVTGVKPPIITDDQPIKNIPIFIGNCRQAQAAMAGSPKLKQTGEQGYSIFPAGGGIAITGYISDKNTDQGTLFGVYAFVENALAIRWYFPIPEEIGKVIPQKKTIALAPYSEKSAPFYKMRLGLITSTLADEIKHPYLREGSTAGPMPNHTQENWRKLYATDHPDYFGLTKDGQSSLGNKRADTGQSRAFLCYSNPRVLQQMISNIEEYDRTGNGAPWGEKGRWPADHFIQFAPDDTGQRCACKECRSLWENSVEDCFGKSSEYIFTFVAKYAHEIEKRWPGRRLRVLAYQDYERPPKNVKLPDNVDVMICLMQPISVQQQPSAFEHQTQIIDAWYELLGKNKERIMIWDYMCWPNCWLDEPVYYPQTLAKWHAAVKQKITGIFNNGMSHSSYLKAIKSRKAVTPEMEEQLHRIHITTFMVWYYARWMWAPDISYPQAVERFCDDMFGPGSGPMREYFTILAGRWDNAKYRNELIGQYRLLPTESDMKRMFPEEIVGKLEALMKSALAKTKEGSSEHKRLTWFYTQAFGGFFEKSKAYWQAANQQTTGQLTRLAAPLVIDGTFDRSAWEKAQPLALHSKYVDKISKDTTEIYAGTDADNLYIAARLTLDPANPVAAAAKGEQNVKVEQDDMFVIHIAVPGKNEYAELAINPAGAYSTEADVIKTRGFFPDCQMAVWRGQGIRVACGIEKNIWTVEAAIPWKSIPGMTRQPPELKAQFLRWLKSDKHHFLCWSPTLTTWEYPLSRFGIFQ